VDTNTVFVIVIVIFAVIAIIAFVVYRQKAKVKATGPFGTGLDVDASNAPAPPTPALKAEGIKRQTGGITATDETGRGLEAKDFDASKDVALRTTAAPKEPPPA
jgi:hypothetical protein